MSATRTTRAPSRSPSSALPDLQIAEMLQPECFTITSLRPSERLDAAGDNIGLCLMAEEGLSGKE